MDAARVTRLEVIHYRSVLGPVGDFNLSLLSAMLSGHCGRRVRRPQHILLRESLAQAIREMLRPELEISRGAWGCRPARAGETFAVMGLSAIDAASWVKAGRSQARGSPDWVWVVPEVAAAELAADIAYRNKPCDDLVGQFEVERILQADS